MQITAGQGSHDFSNDETQYPLIRLIDFANETIPANYQIQLGMYCIFISPLADQQGRLHLLSPRQFMDAPVKQLPYHPMGQALVFHPDLIQGTTLADCLNEFSFFNYSANKTLSLSAGEYRLAVDCFSNIRMELSYALDRHSKRLVASNIGLLLNYCERFFSRNFIMVKNGHEGLLKRFDKMLNHYFSSECPCKFGIPSVAYCADQLHLSAKYFGSLVKKETGKTAQEYIRNKIMEEAQYRMLGMDKTVTEVAYELGFKYPQHFNHFFKKGAGLTPTEYRNTNANVHAGHEAAATSNRLNGRLSYG